MKKIIIIKLGALGDVVRTLCILPAVKEKYPDSDITWITKPNAVQVFENNPYVRRVITMPISNDILNERFDLLYNFDIEKEATQLASKIKADKKYGFYDNDGYPAAFNPKAEYYLNTVFDDELKKSNKKTYQEMMFEAAELSYKKQPCTIYLNEKDRKYADDFVRKNNVKTDKLLGIHMGSGLRWPSKAWHESKIIEFLAKANKKGYEIILFAGPDERQDKIEKIISELKNKGVKIYQNNPNNTFKEFASLVNLCKKIICSDSLALHVALALKKPTVALFFCTSPDEVEGYDLLKKIISPILYDFFPEKQDQYSEKLVNSISADDVLKAVESD